MLDSELKHLQSAGIRAMHSPKITMRKKKFCGRNVFWGIVLRSLMVYMNRLYFALCGGTEHRNLQHKPSQIQLIKKFGGQPYLTL